MSTNKKLYIVHKIKNNQILATTHSHILADFTEYGEQIIDLLKSEITTTIELDDYTYVIECIKPQSKIYIFGGGTVALPLSKMCKLCNFSVVVFDNRKDFANKERFLEADEVVCDSFSNILETYPFQDNSYFVIVTRGHQSDENCLKAILNKHYAYVGMIGSKRKSKLLLSNLEKAGIPPEKIKDVHSPIGLSINAKTPEEIAVSILGQIIETKNLGNTQECSLEIFEHINKPCIMCTLILSKGSTPRKMGCKMLVYKDGNIYGTIGGGALEFKTIEKAKELLKSTEDYTFLDFCLSNQDAANAGMVCGGQARVLLEKIE